MKTATEAAIKLLAEKITGSVVSSTSAMQFTQAALNLAHVLATLDNLRCGAVKPLETPAPVPAGMVPEPVSDSYKLLREVTQALEDLSFECDGVFTTKAPTRETYNRTFDIMNRVRAMLSAPQPQAPATLGRNHVQATEA